MPATPLSPRAVARQAEIGGFACPPRGGFALAPKLEWFSRLAQLSRRTDVGSRRQRTKLETPFGVGDSVFVWRRCGREEGYGGTRAQPRGEDRSGRLAFRPGRARILPLERGRIGAEHALLDSPAGLTYLRRPPAPQAPGAPGEAWGHSSAGRALAWHARGRRFDPAWLHHPATPDRAGDQPLGRTIGRSRSNSTQSPFSISASRPSSRSSAMRAWCLS
jgi:hypothetical protein